MSQALYRKYRSTSFDELVGQEHVTELLKSAVKNGNFSHAYLFTGQRGTGKTSAARILAYAINELPYDADAGHLDIIEIDAASNRRIDDIRDLREKVFIAPVSAKYKVYIIDEVHMLTGESFNALLKTIEEPPAHAVFILATTELYKVPATIISRTQRFHFRPVGAQKVVEHLKMIAKKERIDIDDKALRLIAEHGGGSFRDSISLLDQLGNLEGKVTADTVESILGRARSNDISTILQYLESGKQPELHALLNDMLSQGISPVTLSEQLVATLLHEPNSTPAHYELGEKLMSVPKAHFPQLLLVATLLGAIAPEEGSGRAETADIGPQILEKRRDRESAASEAPLVSKPLRSPQQRGDTKSQLEPSVKTASGSLESRKPGATNVAQVEVGPTAIAEQLTGGVETQDGVERAVKTEESALKPKKKDSENKVSAFDWDKVLAAAKKTNPALHSVLSRAEVKLDGDTLHLAFQYALHRKKLDQTQYRTQLARIILDVCNTTPTIVIDDTNSSSVAHDDTAKKVADLMGGGERVTV